MHADSSMDVNSSFQNVFQREFMSESLCLDKVSKFYGQHKALNELSLTIRPGEIVGLLGPNGSGKTTTLRCIAGYLAVDSGSISVCGHDMRHDALSARRNIGYLPERPPLYDTLTVTENLQFIAAARNILPTLQRQEIERVIAAFSLNGVRKKATGKLSKGFRQRVGLAQASIGNPKVMLLDEATNGLDPIQIMEARSMIRDSAEGRAVVFSSHLMQEVSALCTRVIILYGGRKLGDIDLNELSVRAKGLCLRLRTKMAATDLQTTLSNITGISDAKVNTIEPGLVQAECSIGEADTGNLYDRVVRIACESGEVVSLTNTSVDLEQIFLELVQDAKAQLTDAAAAPAPAG